MDIMDMFPTPENSGANLVGRVMLNVYIRNFDKSDLYASSIIENACFEGQPLTCVKAPKKMEHAALGLTIREFTSLAEKLGFKCGKPIRFLADGIEQVNIEKE